MTFVDFQSDPDVIWSTFTDVTGYLAFDVGANGGRVAALLADRFERVVAFEPCAESFDHLARSAPPNVRCEQLALSDHAGPVTFVEAERAIALGELVTGSSLPGPWGVPVAERTVQAVTFDGMAARYGTPDFVKIDTEGHEALIVEGGRATLGDVAHILIEVHSADNEQRIRDVLPGRSWHVTRHPAYGLTNPDRANHFWMRSQL